MNDPIRSIHGVSLVNLNWGYQVTHGGLVLAAIHDTIMGPHRTNECSEEARKKYERLCGLYERLYSYRRKPSQWMLTTLAHIINQPSASTSIARPHASVIKALRGRGVIKRVVKGRQLGWSGYSDWEPVFSDRSGQP